MIRTKYKSYFRTIPAQRLTSDNSKQIDSLTVKLSKLNDLYLDDRITLDELRAKSSDFIKQRTALEEEIKSLIEAAHENGEDSVSNACHGMATWLNTQI